MTGVKLAQFQKNEMEQNSTFASGMKKIAKFSIKQFQHPTVDRLVAD